MEQRYIPDVVLQNEGPMVHRANLSKYKYTFS